MRIHMNLTRENANAVLRTACERSGAKFTRFSWHDSRSHVVAAEVRLCGESGRQSNPGQGGKPTWEAASWDQRGIFLATIFEVDPSAKTAEYEGSEEFHAKTCGRFDMDNKGVAGGGMHDRSHPDYKKSSHNWTYDMVSSQPFSGIRRFYCTGHGPARTRVSCEARMTL